MMILDLYAGPGGWDLAAHALGHRPIGLELDASTCATRAAAGLTTIRTDIATYPSTHIGPLDGLIASPPCPAFSAAGHGHGTELRSEIATHIHREEWDARPHDDPLVWLTLDLGRWLIDTRPRWIACEQVPAVLPLWAAYAHVLERHGYHTWVGELNAADYGVPQTRRRAILLAHRDRHVSAPPATHDIAPAPTLFGDELAPWVSMADALGWAATDKVGFPRLDDIGDSDDGYRTRDWHLAAGPAPALTEKARSWQLQPSRQAAAQPRDVDGPAPTLHFGHAASDWVWMNTGRDWKPGGTRADAQRIATTAPAPTVSGQTGAWWLERPATTIAGDPRFWPPGHKINADDERRLGAEEAARRYGDRAGTEAIRLSTAQALVLQSFPSTYPLQGSTTSQFQQIGNAVPPLLAYHLLTTLA